MATQASPWVWDAQRAKYYRFSSHEDCYIYQDGLKLDRSGQPIDPTAPRTIPTAGATTLDSPSGHIRNDSGAEVSYVTGTLANLSVGAGGAEASAAINEGAQQEDENDDDNEDDDDDDDDESDEGDDNEESVGVQPVGDAAGVMQTGAEGEDDESSEEEEQEAGEEQEEEADTGAQSHVHDFATSYATNTAQAGTSSAPASAAYSAGDQEAEASEYVTVVGSPPVQAMFQEFPKDQITPPDILASGRVFHKRLIGTDGDVEALDPRYFKRPNGREFFRFGKVFKTLWPEPAGDPKGTFFLKDGFQGRFGEWFFVKIRWFVVIRESNTSCTCLSIQTYGRQGVAKPEVIKHEHAIVYTGGTPPQPRRDEQPRRRELGMRDPVKVVALNLQDKMDPMSRINFAKPYTIEHNLKVYDFGWVAPEAVNYLIYPWYQAMGIPLPSYGVGQASSAAVQYSGYPHPG